MRNANGTLQCDMSHDCTRTVTHVEEKGWVYCAEHGIARRTHRRCRRLRPWEVLMLRKGQPLPSYKPLPKPLNIS